MAGKSSDRTGGPQKESVLTGGRPIWLDCARTITPARFSTGGRFSFPEPRN